MLSGVQAAVRARIGEGVTAFTRIEDGARSVAAGNVVKLAVRPALMGVVQHFIVHQAWPLNSILKWCALVAASNVIKLAVRPALMGVVQPFIVHLASPSNR